MQKVETCHLIRNPDQCVERCRWYRPPAKSGKGSVGWCSLDTDRALDDLSSLCHVANEHVDRTVIDALKADLKVVGALRPGRGDADDELCSILTRSVVAYAFLRQFGQTESQIRAHIRQAQSSWAHQYLPRAFGFHVKDIDEYVSDVDRLFAELQRKFSGKRDDRLAREALKLIQHPDRSQGSLWTYVLGGTFLLSLVALAAWVASSSTEAPLKEPTTSPLPLPTLTPPPPTSNASTPTSNASKPLPTTSNGSGFWSGIVPQVALTVGASAGLYALISRTRSTAKNVNVMVSNLERTLPTVGQNITSCDLPKAETKVTELQAQIESMNSEIDGLRLAVSEHLKNLTRQEEELDKMRTGAVQARNSEAQLQEKLTELERTSKNAELQKKNEISLLEARLETIGQEFERVTSNVNQKGQEAEKAVAKITQLETERSELLNKIEANKQREAEIDSIARSHQNTQIAVVEATSELLRLRTELNASRSETTELQDLLKRLEQSEERLATEIKAQKEAHANEIRTFENVVTDLNEEQFQLINRLNELRAQEQILKNENASLRTQLETDRRNQDARVNELEKELDAEKEQAKLLQAELSKVNDILNRPPPPEVRETLEKLGAPAARSWGDLFAGVKNWVVPSVCSLFSDLSPEALDFYHETIHHLRNIKTQIQRENSSEKWSAVQNSRVNLEKELKEIEKQADIQLESAPKEKTHILELVNEIIQLDEKLGQLKRNRSK